MTQHSYSTELAEVFFAHINQSARFAQDAKYAKFRIMGAGFTAPMLRMTIVYPAFNPPDKYPPFALFAPSRFNTPKTARLRANHTFDLRPSTCD